MLMGGFGEGDEDDEDDAGFYEFLTNVDALEGARRKGDPLNSLEVAPHIAELFKEIAQKSPELMQSAAAQLTPTQVEHVQRIFQ